MNRQKEEEAFLYWLYCIEGLGRKKIDSLLEVCKKAKNVYLLRDDFIDALGFLTQKNKVALKEAQKRRDILEQYEKLGEKGIGFIPWGSREYPWKCKHIPDAPFGIFCSGKMPDANVPSVAIIGARQCTEYGRYVATCLGTIFAREGIQVISGMARGIDSIAQNAAMEAGGETFAVLGCGVDRCYPPECSRLYEQLKIRGGILSEYPPGTEPKASYFPRRNRIISGLSDAVVVVEAREKSGTLITVDMALEQGREVYIVPGRLTDPLSVGCNRLICQGAEMVVDFAKLAWEVRQLHERQWTNHEKQAKPSDKPTFVRETPDRKQESQKKEEMTTIQKEICRILYLEGKSMQQIYNELSEKMQLDIAAISENLFQMEGRKILCQKDGFYELMTGQTDKDKGKTSPFCW